jgi:hypothetical protein
VPGNGVGSVQHSNFYGWLQRKVHDPPSVEAVLRDMPGRQPVRYLLERCLALHMVLVHAGLASLSVFSR